MLKILTDAVVKLSDDKDTVGLSAGMFNYVPKVCGNSRRSSDVHEPRRRAKVIFEDYFHTK